MASVNEFDPAGDYNFVIRQGDTFTRGVSLSTNGTAINLTNSSAVFTVAEMSGGSAVLQLSVGSGVVMGGTAGTVSLTASAAQTAVLDPGVYVYDFTLLQNATVTTLLAGQFQVLGQV